MLIYLYEKEIDTLEILMFKLYDHFSLAKL